MTAFYLLCIFAFPLLLAGQVRAQEDTQKPLGDEKAVSGPSTFRLPQEERAMANDHTVIGIDLGTTYS